MNKKDTFLAYLTDQQQLYEKDAQALIADDRKDETNVKKAQANIFQIFQTIYETAYQKTEKSGGTPDMAEAFFLEKAKSIPLNWEKAYEAAKAHQDAKRILMESAKLAVVDEILKTYENQLR